MRYEITETRKYKVGDRVEMPGFKDYRGEIVPDRKNLIVTQIIASGHVEGYSPHNRLKAYYYGDPYRYVEANEDFFIKA